MSSGELSAVCDEDLPLRLVPAGGGHVFDGAHHIHPALHPPEHAVPAVEVGGGGGGDEELRPVRVWASVGHREHACHAVRELVVELLVRKLLPVDALAAPAVAAREVAALAHEPVDHAVEPRPLVVKRLAAAARAFLAGAKCAEILGSLRHQVREQLELDPPFNVAPNGDVKVDNRITRLLAAAAKIGREFSPPREVRQLDPVVQQPPPQ
mmetsp:Transcript_6771/g.15750  ORF Transcript_6771/g.15750 Transcript_6771/m.15750 type:complete len:210 (-) Transcript_6771:74-703(-)